MSEELSVPLYLCAESIEGAELFVLGALRVCGSSCKQLIEKLPILIMPSEEGQMEMLFLKLHCENGFPQQYSYPAGFAGCWSISERAHRYVYALVKSRGLDTSRKLSDELYAAIGLLRKRFEAYYGITIDLGAKPVIDPTACRSRRKVVLA